jgi:E3 ubiquitin-protein ligase synoviolin
MFPPVGFPPVQQFPQPQPFHGSASQVLRRGDEGLPEGLVLPEGWTLTPLRPMGGQAAIVPAADVQQANGEMVGSSQEVQAGDGVPRNENGSPLFVPTVPEPAPTANGAPSAPLDTRHESSSSTAQTAGPLPTEPSSQPAPSQSEDAIPPWNSEGGWSFVDPPLDANGHATEQADNASTSNGAPKPPDQEGSGKGKGKQPAVEDAPDEGT